MCVPPAPAQGHQGTAAAQQHSRTAMRQLCNLGVSRGVDAVAPTPTLALAGAPTGVVASETREYWGQRPAEIPDSERSRTPHTTPAAALRLRPSTSR
ncbi:hypothetical protein NDU88_011883 [Pleurodeles waltl]|uniref:Uncharacterized protein n=1 Tax=Pleurodeles waltl TaxID=8319 RepID=A0AAV7R1A9_PLEWA|nr:hypothetical protein NDU88_011883 [Pleurodeles waltl]